MPVTPNHLCINNNPSSHRQRKHTKYIKISINSTYGIQKHKQMITKICSKSYSKCKIVKCEHIITKKPVTFFSSRK